jgi:hypothetical protein
LYDDAMLDISMKKNISNRAVETYIFNNRRKISDNETLDVI